MKLHLGGKRYNILVISLVMTLFSFIFLHAQTESDSTLRNFKFGGYFDLGPTFHVADFLKLPGVPNCCEGFKNGSGFGWEIGGLVDYFINEDLFAQLRLGLNTYGGILTSNEIKNIIVDGKSTDGTIQHYLNASLASFGIHPNINYKIYDELFVSGGLSLAFVINKKYNQKEEIITPSDRGTFADGTRIRNQFEGTIESASSIQLAFDLGLNYTLPLNKKGWLMATPELKYSYQINPVISGLKWSVHSIKAGVSVKYKQPPPPPPPPLPPLDPPDPSFPTPPVPAILSASVSVVQVDSTNKEMQDFSLKIEDFISLNMRPLLNYIFFDENSSVIPKRYYKLKTNEVNQYSSKNLNNLDVMSTYYNILNIIGRRLKDNPTANIKLIGTNSNCNDETGNKDLSSARAISVRDYFKDVWGIAEDRMKIEARNLPKEHSATDEETGNAENRRVEIVPDDFVIMEPVVTIDTVRQINNYKLRFFPSAKASAGLKNWKFLCKQKDKVLLKYEGTKSVPDSIDWIITQRDTSSPTSGGQIFYNMTVEDALGQKASSPQYWVPIDQMTIERKRVSKLADKEFEYYSLILFDFGKSTLGKEHQSVLDFVKQRVKPESSVMITGYTDASGDDDVNLKLSTKRAQAAAKRIDIPYATVKGVGESELLYDNILPEGRFYCRTVKISIETPIKNGK